jgi:hypothetical protein
MGLVRCGGRGCSWEDEIEGGEEKKVVKKWKRPVGGVCGEY